MAPRKPKLETLAEDAQFALDSLAAEGYEREVVTIRLFIQAMGEAHREQMRMQHKIAADLSRGKQQEAKP